MRVGGGGEKGAVFERKVCVELSKAMTGDQRKDLFWRTSMSGGRATIMNRKGGRNLSQTGDITAIDPLGNWLTDQALIECKHHKEVEFDHYLLNRGGRIAKWLTTAKSQAGDKKFFLIFKQNGLPTLVLTNAGQLLGKTGSNNMFSLGPLAVLIVPDPAYLFHLTLFKFDHMLALIRQIHAEERPARRRPKA